MSPYTFLALFAVLCAEVVVAGKMEGGGGDMMMMKKKMMMGAGGPSLTWNINVGGGGAGGSYGKKKMMMAMGMMMKMMTGAFDMSKGWCRDKCYADNADCPNGAQDDLTGRGDMCRTCMLECMTCKSEGLMTKIKTKMAKKHKMMREGKMMMPDMDNMDMEKMMQDDMMKKNEEGKTAFEAALDTMKMDQMSLMNVFGMNCDKFWPTPEEVMAMGPKFMEMMKKEMKM